VSAGPIFADPLGGTAAGELEIEPVIEAQIDDPGAAVLLRQFEERLETELLVEGDRFVEIARFEIDVSQRLKRAHDRPPMP